MAEWPDEAELAQVLNIDDPDVWAVTLSRVLASAIETVKADVGLWDDGDYYDDGDEPDERLAQAALRMAVLISEQPSGALGRLDVITELRADPTYRRLISGHRRVFGIA